MTKAIHNLDTLAPTKYMRWHAELLAREFRGIGDRIVTRLPESAKEYHIKADVCEMFARVALELDESPRSNTEVTQLSYKPTETLAIVHRLLKLILIDVSIDDAAAGDAPDWLRDLVQGNGRE